MLSVRLCTNIILILPLVALLPGCYELEKRLYRGTVKAVVSCLNSIEDELELLSEYRVRRSCIDEHQQTIPMGDITGRSRLEVNGEALEVTRLSLQNIPSEFVLTEITLIYTLYDAAQNVFEIPYVKNLWVEGPRDNYEINYDFDIDRPEGLLLPEATYNGGCGSEGEREQCFVWRIDNIKGLTI